MAGAAGRCGNDGALRTGSGGKGWRGPEGVRLPPAGAAIGRAGTDTLRLATPGACGCEGGARGGCKAPPACMGGRSGRNGLAFSVSGGGAGAGAPGAGDAAATGGEVFSGPRAGSRATRRGGCIADGGVRGVSGSAGGAGRFVSSRSGSVGGSATATDVSVICSELSCSPLPSA
jgi:hypothetical protein